MRDTRRRVRAALAGITLLLVLAGCTMFGRSRGGEDRFATPGSPRRSPSGTYTASVIPGTPQSGVSTWVVVISDGGGREVFHDDYAYSTRHGVGVTWRSDQDQLWLLSSDIGTAYVEPDADGAWVKTAITPQTRDTIPEEIRRLG